MRQDDGAVANPDQPAHRQPDGVEELAHLAIATLGDDDAIPLVEPFAAAVDDRLEGGALAVDLDPFEQLGARVVVEMAHDAHRVLALDAEARVHQLVGETARGREEQQALGVDVEPSDRLPLALLQARQAAKDGRPVLRVVVADDLAGRLVVRDDPRRRRHDAQAHRLAVHLDAVAERNALARVRRLAVDGDAALLDRLFHVAARADSRLRQHLVQLRRVGLRREDALARGLFGLRLFGNLAVELAGDDVREHLGRLDGNRRLQMARQRPFEIRGQRPPEAAIVAVAAIAAAAVTPVAPAAALAGRRRAVGLGDSSRFATIAFG